MIACSTSPPGPLTQILAVEGALCEGSENVPNGVTPLKSRLARPSQKLSRLKIAMMAFGVLRPVTCRVVLPGVVSAQSSIALLGVSPLKSSAGSPWEPTTSSCCSLLKGKLAAENAIVSTFPL